MTEQRLCEPDDLSRMGLGRIAVWGSRDRAEVVAERAGGTVVEDLEHSGEFDTLIVVGGGTRIDAAKAWRADHAPEITLVAVPSLWGSGAEASGIVVTDTPAGKSIRMGDEFLPDIRCVFPQLMDSLDEPTVRHACGDAWSHALEGMLSPLADEALRLELARLIADMLESPIGPNLRWFELSARACQGQARSGVGLVHGIAHTLEKPLGNRYPDEHWGHARLCATYLFPVMAFNRQASDRFDSTLAGCSLDPEQVLTKTREMFVEADYDAAFPALTDHWVQVLRDPCTRTNSALVRRSALDFFTNRGFQ